jgi:hypothetical protein
VIEAQSYIPFLYPINALHDYPHLLLIPLAFGISVVYKALRMRRLDGYWRHVAIMTTQVVLAMVALAIGLTILVQVVVPRLPVH